MIQQMHHYMRTCDCTILISELNSMLGLNVGGLDIYIYIQTYHVTYVHSVINKYCSTVASNEVVPDSRYFHII